MKSKYTFFLIAALFVSNVRTEDAATRANNKKDLVTRITDILRRAIDAPGKCLSGYFLMKVGKDLYENHFSELGAKITDADITKKLEGIFPGGYTDGISKWALQCIVGYAALAATRAVALDIFPDFLRGPVEKLTRAAA